MEFQKKNKTHWFNINSTLQNSLKKIPKLSEREFDLISINWNLIVGKEISRQTRVDHFSDTALFVEVLGPEWLTPLKSLEKKILEALNRNIDKYNFQKIRFRVKPQSLKENHPKLQMKNKPIAHPFKTMNFSNTKESTKHIKDPELKKTLVRLASKFRFSTWILAVILFYGCSTTPKVNFEHDPETSQMGEAFVSKRIHALKQKHPDKEYRDPRAYFHYLKAMQLEREGDFDGAALHFSRVVRYDSTQEKHYTKLVILYLRTGRLDDALESGTEALNHFPNNLRIRMIMADILSTQGKYQQALQHYKKIIDIDPSNSRALLLTGYVLKTLKEYDQAKEQFKKVTIVDPGNPLGYHYLGTSLARSGEMESAEEKFKKSINLRPGLLEARQNLARVLELQQKYEEAAKQYQIILKVDPSNETVKNHLESMHFKNQADAGSTNLNINSKDATFPWDEPNIHRMLGAIFYEQAVYLGALDEFRLALANEEDRELRLAIAKIFELFGRMDKAIKEVELSRANSPDPNSVDVLLQLARLHGLNREMKVSVDYLNKALVLEPENDRLYHALALAHMSLDENEEAIRNINKAISLNDQKDSYFYEQGTLFSRVGNDIQAIKSMKQTLAINPSNSNAHNFIGYTYAKRGEALDEAVDHLEQALTIQPKNAYFLDSLGWIYHKKGQHEKALTQIKKALIYIDPDPVLYDHLGDVYFSMDNLTEAVKAWKTSLILTLQKFKAPSEELPTPKDLRSKIKKASDLLHSN